MTSQQGLRCVLCSWAVVVWSWATTAGSQPRVASSPHGGVQSAWSLEAIGCRWCGLDIDE